VKGNSLDDEINEEAEFTILNCVAFDYARKEAKDRGQLIPCWLCMSVEAREAARTKLLESMSRMMGMGARITESNFDLLMSSEMAVKLAILTKKWREAELEYKKLREEGNPCRAFFAD